MKTTSTLTISEPLTGEAILPAGLRREALPDGSIWWTVHAALWNVGPRYFGPFRSVEGAYAFYEQAQAVLNQAVVDLLNVVEDIVERRPENGCETTRTTG